MANPTIESKIQEVASRIRELRLILGYSEAELAAKTGISEAEYRLYESGKMDLNFAFLYTCAQALEVDVTELIEGSSPHLSSYTLTRAGQGQRVEQAHGMVYYNMAYRFRNRIAEPLFVHSAYSEEAQRQPIELTTHNGQECDIIIRGSLIVQIGEHRETLHAGDTIYYDSSTPHGMIATGGYDCDFYALVLTPEEGTTAKAQYAPTIQSAGVEKERICAPFLTPHERADGSLERLDFHNTEAFNFAFDVVDAIAEKTPDRLAMLHLDRNRQERRFTFEQMKKLSNRAANYFRAMGIRKGDKVMLVLRRNWQFWPVIIGLEKLGAIAIPAVDQLLEKDFTYRFQTAGVSALVCTADGESSVYADLAAANYSGLRCKILCGGCREGWHSFDDEYEMYSSRFSRTEDSICGDDPMMMIFTSGSTGYPKLAVHSCKYPLGHYVTARYWHCVQPDGLHLTISDTGWAKAMWGKLFGQWMCEGSIFVYDFDRFHAEDILPLFAKYGITSFCAPPTIYRFLIKDDALARYDLSSIRHASTAGEAMNPEVFQRFREVTGLSIMEGFGQTEATILIGNFVGMSPKVGSMGKPNPAYRIELLSPDGAPVPDGQPGEICVYTADGTPCGLFCGYYENEADTSAAWHDGWYHTGDLAWRDEDDYLWYVGRADDLIKSSGYRIGPFEIESVIMELPYVLECGVSPAPDEIRGQIVKASIVLVKGKEATEELKKEIQDYVKKRTAPYKYPRLIVFRESLPKTTSGKIIRAKL